MITLATAADLPQILAIYAHARAFMAQHGNPNQWGASRPTEADITAHIAARELYGTIHAVASDGQIHGLLSQIVAYCEQTTKHLRIDTHHDNAIMQHVILKNGFTRCGIIHIASGAERIAFEKV